MTDSNTVGEFAGATLTLEKLRAMAARIRRIPPPPRAYSSVRFPAIKPLIYTAPDGAQTALAHPDLWRKAAEKVTLDYRATFPADPLGFGGGFGITIIDLDDPLRRDLLTIIEREAARTPPD
jgi:hypothetical protein